MTRVLFLTLYPETMPSSRLRVYQYLPYLRPLGIEACVLPALPEPWFSRLYYSRSKAVHALQYIAEAVNSFVRLRQARNYDVVFVQKGMLSTSVRGFDRLLGPARRLIFDLDDSLFGRSVVEFSSPLLRWLQDPSQLEKISARSEAVVVGNSYLRDRALQFNPNVFLIPTPVDTQRFRPLEKKSTGRNGEVVLGWMGTESGLPYLGILAQALADISKRYRVRLKLITGPLARDFAPTGAKTDWVPWSYETEVAEAGGFDIGLMPLPEDEWSRGKCGLKLLQYMALGLPSVSSPVGANAEIVEEGRDGLLAAGTEEWVEKLSRLIEDEPLRRHMGEAARKKAVEKYSVEKLAPKLARVLTKEAAGNN